MANIKAALITALLMPMLSGCNAGTAEESAAYIILGITEGPYDWNSEKLTVTKISDTPLTYKITETVHQSEGTVAITAIDQCRYSVDIDVPQISAIFEVGLRHLKSASVEPYGHKVKLEGAEFICKVAGKGSDRKACQGYDFQGKSPLFMGDATRLQAEVTKFQSEVCKT